MTDAVPTHAYACMQTRPCVDDGDGAWLLHLTDPLVSLFMFVCLSLSRVFFFLAGAAARWTGPTACTTSGTYATQHTHTGSCNLYAWDARDPLTPPCLPLSSCLCLCTTPERQAHTHTLLTHSLTHSLTYPLHNTHAGTTCRSSRAPTARSPSKAQTKKASLGLNDLKALVVVCMV